MNLASKIKRLQSNKVRELVESRLTEFDEAGQRSEQYWFAEMCYCILTANARAATALKVEREVGVRGYRTLTLEELTEAIRGNKHRFHNNKARFIVKARSHKDLKRTIKAQEEKEARKWLANNVDGIGYKEASHFLRNVGYKGLAILDRHVIKLMLEYGLLKEPPITLRGREYLRVEGILEDFSAELGMSQAELDLYMWYMKTGKVLK